MVPNTQIKVVRHTDSQTQCCELLTEPGSSSTSNSGAQTDQWDQSFAAADVSPLSEVPWERPRPRPRFSLSAQPISREVKVQTLVKLREDGLATLAARATADSANQEVSQGKYLQELLEAFSSDDWGLPDRYSDSSEHSQLESEEEDMGTLKARIQAFEQQPVADGSWGDSKNRDSVVSKRPEPRPRPRLQGQPAKSVPPIVAPKPKNFSNTPKPSFKQFWEDDGLTAADSCSTEAVKTTEISQTANEPPPSFDTKSGSTSVAQPCKTTEKPSVTPKPPTEALQSGTSVPVPAPRPLPPKLSSSVSEISSFANPKPPPRPAVAPRASIGATLQEKSASAGHMTPTLPPRLSSGAQTETGSAETQSPANLTGECSL